jgi:hypothetical protein
MPDAPRPPAAEREDLSASWFPEWNIEHMSLTCQRCVTWGGPASCAAIEGLRRGFSSAPTITAAEMAALDRLEDRLEGTLWDEAVRCKADVRVLLGLARRAGAAPRDPRPYPCPSRGLCSAHRNPDDCTPRAGGDEDDDYYAGIRPVLDADGHELVGDTP